MSSAGSINAEPFNWIFSSQSDLIYSIELVNRQNHTKSIIMSTNQAVIIRKWLKVVHKLQEKKV